MAAIQPPPTYADVVIIDERTKKGQFNPIWLKWFIDLTKNLGPSGAGTVTSVGLSGGTTGITVSGSPITIAGAFTLGGTLVVANGGTGNTTGTATVNANLTGPITSVGNATSIASQTGTGTKFVVDTSPTLVTPLLGTPTSGILTNCTGTASGLTAGTVTTNANLTGPITSAGNATSIASQTGTGTKFVVDTSPTLVTPNIGIATGTSVNLSSGATITSRASDAIGVDVAYRGADDFGAIRFTNNAVNATRAEFRIGGSSGTIDIFTGSTLSEQLQINNTASSANFITITGSAAGNPAIGASTGDIADTTGLTVAGRYADTGYSFQTPATGFSITLGNTTQNTILDPAGILATGTITMPATPVDGQIVRFASSTAITALTVSANAGQSIKDAITTLAAGASAAYLYHLANTTWYRVQ